MDGASVCVCTRSVRILASAPVNKAPRSGTRPPNLFRVNSPRRRHNYTRQVKKFVYKVSRVFLVVLSEMCTAWTMLN